MSIVEGSKSQRVDRVGTVARELLAQIQEGAALRPAAEQLFDERRDYLPVGTSVDEIISAAAGFARQSAARTRAAGGLRIA